MRVSCTTGLAGSLSSIVLLAACGGGGTATSAGGNDQGDGSVSTTHVDSGIGHPTSHVDAASPGSPDDSGTPMGTDASVGPGDDAGNASDGGGALGQSKIAHVIVIVQENHTFDTYFGKYCTAAAGSNPSCTSGPSCCEAAPDKDPSGASPTALTDSQNAAYDPNHTQSCELGEMNGSAMDRYVTGASCSNAENFALADPSVVQPYIDWANQYALADRYFQPLVGASTSNDMYFAVANYVFTDDTYFPDTSGHGCDVPPTTTIEYTGKTTLADILTTGGRTFSFYAEGYAAMLASAFCPLPPSDCPAHIPTVPCNYDPSDNPFEYYQQLADNKTYEKDLGQLATDLSGGTLPDVSFVKFVQYHNEHPGYGTTISTGTEQVTNLVSQITSSAYGDDTLILLTWDEGGGFFDHVPPPPDSAVDGQPYGTRVPLLALGHFAKKGVVSHVTMEHSSVVRFVEWNFLGSTGQLGARDAVVANIGSLLDPAETGVQVPEN